MKQSPQPIMNNMFVFVLLLFVNLTAVNWIEVNGSPSLFYLALFDVINDCKSSTLISIAL